MWHSVIVDGLGNKMLFHTPGAVDHVLLLAYIALVFHLQLDLLCYRFREHGKDCRKRRLQGMRYTRCQASYVAIGDCWPAQEFSGREHLSQRGKANFLGAYLICTRGGKYQG